MAESPKRRIVFMGTPDFAAQVLNGLLHSEDYEVVAIYTRPDKKSGRGLKTIFSEVKKLALEHGIPLFQPSTLRTPSAVRDLAACEADYLIVAAYGLILPQEILDLPKIAPINVHASLLPALRGAAPIQRAIMENPQKDAKTGISIMKMLASLDTGPVYAQKEVPIEHKNSETLERELAKAGSELLLQVLSDIDKKNLQPVPQDESKATYANKLEKDDGLIDWNKSAQQVDAQVRAVMTWPGAQTSLLLASGDELRVNILEGHPGRPCSEAPGSLMRHKKGLAIACNDCWYEVEKLRPQGRKAMSSADFANGQIKIRIGLCGYAKKSPC